MRSIRCNTLYMLDWFGDYWGLRFLDVNFGWRLFSFKVYRVLEVSGKMAIFKCKMCGGDLEVNAGESVITCDYCGAQQTLPRLDNEKRANMYDRANHFRRNNDFDKAMSIYESILNEDGTDAEAYWSIVLCRYGIEYVEDPMTKRRIPTVNRAQYTSVLADEDYKSAYSIADL